MSKFNWTLEINKFLKGKTIKGIRYLTDKEMNDLEWYNRPVVIMFTDGSYIIPQSDDEGNDGGSLFTSHKGRLTVIPVNGK